MPFRKRRQGYSERIPHITIMNRIDRKFKELKKSREKAFIAFITAGYPGLLATEKLVLAFDKIGVDIVELGVPFSDPMADGPLIQEASQAALKKHVHLEDILKLVKRVRSRTQVPLCLMTYYNPVFCYGDERFLKDAKKSGVDGVIIPDLPPEEGKLFIRLADEQGIDCICFAAPTTSSSRMQYIEKAARGFIYYVSLTGVTGPRQTLPSDLASQLRRFRRLTSKPICVGFGISTARQVKEIQKLADGVIVGSAIIRKIKECLGSKDLVKRVSRFVKDLKG
jgi:tryptophan synthase alpha chain